MANLTEHDLTILEIIDANHDCQEITIYDQANLSGGIVVSSIQFLDNEEFIEGTSMGWNTTFKGANAVATFKDRHDTD